MSLLLQQLKTYLDTTKNIVFIVPFKYHDYLYYHLLEEDKPLFNFKLVDIKTFTQQLLSDNNLACPTDSSIVAKLAIQQKLRADQHVYQDSINYLEELFKLQQECHFSNVTLIEGYGKYLPTQVLNLSNLTCLYDEIIILSQEDFYPLHQEILNNLSVKITYLPLEKLCNYQCCEHNNIVRMLDYIIYDLVTNPQDNTLLICDNIYQQDYLINKFNELGLEINVLNQQSNITINYLNSLLALINHDYTAYDLQNINKIFQRDLTDQLVTLSNLDYQDYLEAIYEILVESALFDIFFLNDLFQDLYFLENIEISLLNKLLFQTLKNSLKTSYPYHKAAVTLADTSFSLSGYDHTYLIDASFSSLRANKTSYLLTTKQREQISPHLITNTFYSERLKNQQQLLLHCAKNIYIHYSVLSIENKPQALAYFISVNNYPLSKKSTISHLSTHQEAINPLLLNNKVSQLANQLIKQKFNDSLTISATALDTFNKCHYQYFVSFILKPHQTPKFDALSLGSLFHEIIDQINKQLIETKLSYTDYGKAALNELILTLVTEKALPLLNDYEIAEYKRAEIINGIVTTLTNFIESMIFQEEYSKYLISASEHSLSAQLTSDHFNKVTLFGKIDTIMSYQASNYLLDYKSGVKEFKEKTFNEGINTQLIVYLYLLKENHKNFIGAFFKSLRDGYEKSDHVLDLAYNKQLHLEKNKLTGLLLDTPYLTDFDTTFGAEDVSVIANITKKKIISHEKLQEYFQTLTSHFSRMIETIASGIFKIVPANKDVCHYCHYKYLCKITHSLNREENDDE